MTTKQMDTGKPPVRSGMAMGVNKFGPGATDKFARADAALAGGANPQMLEAIRSGTHLEGDAAPAVPDVPAVPATPAQVAHAPAVVQAPAPVLEAPVAAPVPVPAPAPVHVAPPAPVPAPAAVAQVAPTPVVAPTVNVAAMAQAAAVAAAANAPAAPPVPMPEVRMTKKIAKARGGVVSETYSVTVEDSQAIDAMRVRATTLTNRILNRSEVVRLGLMLLSTLTDEQATELVKLLPNLATRRGR